MVKVRATLALMLSTALLSGCTISGNMTGPNGQSQPSSVDANIPLLGQGPQVSRFPPLPPLTGALPTDPQTGTLTPQAQPLPPAVPTAPTATSQGAPASMSVADYVARLQAQHGVRIVGSPTIQGLLNLGSSLALYPAGAVRNAVINFTGRNAGSVGGTWQTGGVINLYQEGAHVCSHELAHHVLEQNRTRWAYQLKSLIAANPTDIPMSSYARENLAQGNLEEVAAEVVSYYAEGRWVPQNANTKASLQAMISNQPQATV